MKTKSRNQNLPKIAIGFEYAGSVVNKAGRRVKCFRIQGDGQEFSEKELASLRRRNPDVTFVYLGV